MFYISQFQMGFEIRRKDASRGVEGKSARYRLRLRGAEREGTSTPSRIDRTVDASPFWRNTCWADSLPRPSLDGHFANDRGMCRGISVINCSTGSYATHTRVGLYPLDIRFFRVEGWSARERVDRTRVNRGWKISYFLKRNYSGLTLP